MEDSPILNEQVKHFEGFMENIFIKKNDFGHVNSSLYRLKDSENCYSGDDLLYYIINGVRCFEMNYDRAVSAILEDRLEDLM